MTVDRSLPPAHTVRPLAAVALVLALVGGPAPVSAAPTEQGMGRGTPLQVRGGHSQPNVRAVVSPSSLDDMAPATSTGPGLAASSTAPAKQGGGGPKIGGSTAAFAALIAGMCVLAIILVILPFVLCRGRRGRGKRAAVSTKDPYADTPMPDVRVVNANRFSLPRMPTRGDGRIGGGVASKLKRVGTIKTKTRTRTRTRAKDTRDIGEKARSPHSPISPRAALNGRGWVRLDDDGDSDGDSLAEERVAEHGTGRDSDGDVSLSSFAYSWSNGGSDAQPLTDAAVVAGSSRLATDGAGYSEDQLGFGLAPRGLGLEVTEVTTNGLGLANVDNDPLNGEPRHTGIAQ